LHVVADEPAKDRTVCRIRGKAVQLEGTPSDSSVELRKIKPTSELVLFPKSVFMLP
jgi:hypothetical protein